MVRLGYVSTNRTSSFEFDLRKFLASCASDPLFHARQGVCADETK